MLCRLFLTSKYCSFNNEKNVKIVGIVDDDRALRGLNVYGFNVLGSGEDLNDIFEHRKFDTIILTCEIPDNEVLQKVKEFCRNNNIKLQKFVCKEEDLI